MQQAQSKEEKDELDVTISAPDHATPDGMDKMDHKSLEYDDNIPQRQSMSPPQNKHSIINNCAVLIIPLDNRVTPQMVANKFIRYGKILQVRPIKKSSTCIVIFSKPSEAANCIRLFESHDKVRVTRPDQLRFYILYIFYILAQNG